MAAAQTRRYKYDRRVRVHLQWEPKSSDAAHTDNRRIHINTGHTLVTKTRGRENRYQLVCGLFAHELGHVLYTDFLVPQTQMNYMEKGFWYPEPPLLHTAGDFANEKALWAYLKADSENLEAVKTVSHFISNALEDGYIENRMLNDFPGTLGFGLAALRKKVWEDMFTVTQLKEKEEDGQNHIFQSILLVMLSYVEFGEIKYGDEDLDDIRIQTIFGIISELDRAVTDFDPKTRLRVVNLILVRCWEYIQDYCEQLKAAKETAKSMAEAVKKSLGGMPGATVAGTGGIPVAGAGSSASLPAVQRPIRRPVPMKAAGKNLRTPPLKLILKAVRMNLQKKSLPYPTRICRLWLARAQTPGNRRLQTRRADVFPTTRLTLYWNRWAAQWSPTLTMSGSSTTRPPLTLTVCWTKWPSVQQLSSWKMSACLS